MPVRTIETHGIHLWTEDFGDHVDETVLLVNGPAPGLAWPDELCTGVADGGRHVIRYDHRDTGASTTIDFSKDPYTLSDLADDAISVLEAYSVAAGHLVGISLGGMIAQTAALEQPDRVASLTSLMSTPWGPSLQVAMGGSTDLDLPGPEPKATRAMANFLQATIESEDEIGATIELMRAWNGTLASVDEGRARARLERSAAHTRNAQAFTNHYLALAASPDRGEMLGRIKAPTLVIHRTLDPLFPLAHGEATARAIPGARLLPVEGMGHDVHFSPVVITAIVEAILEHTASVKARR